MTPSTERILNYATPAPAPGTLHWSSGPAGLQAYAGAPHLLRFVLAMLADVFIWTCLPAVLFMLSLLQSHEPAIPVTLFVLTVLMPFGIIWINLRARARTVVSLVLDETSLTLHRLRGDPTVLPASRILSVTASPVLAPFRSGADLRIILDDWTAIPMRWRHEPAKVEQLAGCLSELLKARKPSAIKPPAAGRDDSQG